jgi:hypothetical protein
VKPNPKSACAWSNLVPNFAKFPLTLSFFSGIGASLTMERWHKELERAMEAQRAEDDEDFKEFEEFFFDELVTSAQEGDSPSPPCRRFHSSHIGRKFVFRGREGWHERLHQDYFAKHPTFDHIKFCRRFRMRRELFFKSHGCGMRI